jgi:hypothetical protein
MPLLSLSLFRESSQAKKDVYSPVHLELSIVQGLSLTARYFQMDHSLSKLISRIVKKSKSLQRQTFQNSLG